MNFRRAVFVLLVVLLGFAVRPLSAAPADPLPLARVHWLGLKTIGVDTNATQFLHVWQLPQTAALVAQTLDKISRLPAAANTNAAALLRPLLDDLVTSEFYLEVCGSTNSGSEIQNRKSQIVNRKFLLALRLPADRARLWQTNLPAALPAAVVSQSGDWTLIGLGTNGSPAVSPVPRHASLSNIWLEADFTPSCLAAVDPSFLSLVTRHASLSHVHLTLTGEAGNVITRATLDFSQPLNLTLPPWEIPTNLIHQPLTSFTAVRGLAPWLATLPAWQKLSSNPPPTQMFCWAKVQAGGPYATYFAAPLPDASNRLSQLAAGLVSNANPWLATHGQGSFQSNSRLPGLVWNDAFILEPFLKAVTVNGRDYALGGLIPCPAGDPNPPPTGIFHAVLDTPNLVYYQAEQTGDRIEDFLFITQSFRIIFNRPQLPAKSAATVWLKNLEPLLASSTTLVTQAGPDKLAIKRKSSIGFTALELHLLADWLESPQFPRGLHTFLAPPDQ